MVILLIVALLAASVRLSCLGVIPREWSRGGFAIYLASIEGASRAAFRYQNFDDGEFQQDE